VSASKDPTEQGQLLILASGPLAAHDRVAPVFAAMGRNTVWLGDAGQGSQTTLVVNGSVSVLIEGVADAVGLEDRLGISHQQLEEVIEGGPLTRRSQAPSSTRWTEATSLRNSRSNGR
jgi:3-hydroxyisobutyrate dehydrogenase